jgi:Regulator of chromosome condensation (RCC1) repeat/PASTA domain
VLGVWLLFVAGPAQAAAAGKPVAWGCGGIGAWGQCSVPNGLSGVTAIAAGRYYGLALRSDSTVVAWGCGLLGLEGACNVPRDLSNVTRIAAGESHALALKADGTVVAWGKSCQDVYTDFEQCDVPSGLSGVTAIAASFAHSLALKGDGTVFAWGCGTASGNSSDHGQCNVPAGLSDVTAIAAAYAHSLALKSNGTVVAWGCTGIGTDYGQCSVPNGLSGVTGIAAGTDHSLALKGDGTVVAWGCGAPTDYGQCSGPNGLSGVASIAAGPFHSLALVELKNQTITFGPLAGKSYGDPDFSVSAAASSGLAVSFNASGNCTLGGVTVHLTGAGSCTVTAAQPGDANYNPAPDVSQTFAIAKAGQTVTFGPLANKTYGARDFSVSATASSGLAVSFNASGNCTLGGVTVHLTGAGSCTVTASQPGDANYNAAPGVSRTFSIVRAPCRVPKVVGKRAAFAKRTIAQRHCRTGKVGYAYSRKRKKSIVISQSRRPGRVLPARSKINLIVSRGRRR